MMNVPVDFRMTKENWYNFPNHRINVMVCGITLSGRNFEDHFK